MRIMNRSQRNALEQKYTFYANSKIAKLRYRFMLVFAAWSVTLLFFHGAQQLMKGSVIFMVGDNISDLEALPYIVSGLVVFTLGITLVAIGEYYQFVKTGEAIAKGRFPLVDGKPPFSIFGIFMIFGSVLALIFYMSILVRFMWSNWLWNVLTLPSLILVILAILTGYSAGLTAYKQLRLYKEGLYE